MDTSKTLPVVHGTVLPTQTEFGPDARPRLAGIGCFLSRLSFIWRKVRYAAADGLSMPIGLRLLHRLNTQPVAADLVYRFAYQFNALRRIARHCLACLNKVKPRELHAYRKNPIFSYLSLNATNICNAKCTFCAYPKVVNAKTLKTGIMPLALFQRAVDEWALAGGTMVDVTPVVGDPLVDPGLIQKIKYVSARIEQAEIGLTTNGILLDHNDNYRNLIDCGVTIICISTQGTNREAYKRVYGTDKYEQVISGVFNLLRYNKSKGEPARIVIRFRNAEKPSEIIRSDDYQRCIRPFFSDKVRVNFTADYDNWGGTITQDDLIGAMRLRKPGPQINVPCVGLFGTAVRHDGKVRLCGCRLKHTDADDLVVGDLHQENLASAVTGERAWQITEGFYRGDRPETCRHCTVYIPVTKSWLRNRAKDLR